MLKNSICNNFLNLLLLKKKKITLKSMSEFSWEALNNKQEGKSSKEAFGLKKKVEKEREVLPVKEASVELRKMIDDVRSEAVKAGEQAKAQAKKTLVEIKVERRVEAEKIFGEAIDLLEQLLTQGEWINVEELRDIKEQIEGKIKDAMFLVRVIEVTDPGAPEGGELAPKVVQVKKIPTEFQARMRKIKNLVDVINFYSGDDLLRTVLEEVAATRNALNVGTIIHGVFNERIVSPQDQERIGLTIENVRIELNRGEDLVK